MAKRKPKEPGMVPQPAGPSDVIEHIETGKLIPYARNSNTHSERQVAQIAASIKEFGFCNPVLIDESETIIAGHGRVLAAELLKLPTCPCRRLGHLTDNQRRAYVIADNRLAKDSEFDKEMLQLELIDLKDMDFDLNVLGFGDDELQTLLILEPESESGDGEVIEDEVPEPPANPITKPGDLWILGNHRLLCGDSTRAEDVSRLLGINKPFLMVTDPPYGVDYDADWRNKALAGKPRADGKVGGGGRSVGKVTNDDVFNWTAAYELSPCHVAYVWHAGRFSCEVGSNIVAADFEIRCQIIWSKSHFAIGRGHYHWQHEPCWYAVRQGGSAKWCGDRTQSTIWQIGKPQANETGHSTQKPVECMARPIRNHGEKTMTSTIHSSAQAQP